MNGILNGIYYKDGIYVTIDDGKSQNDICVYNYHKDNVSLYGGRIKITYSDEEEANLNVDGISIIKISNKSEQIINTIKISINLMF